MTKTFF